MIPTHESAASIFEIESICCKLLKKNQGESHRLHWDPNIVQFIVYFTADVNAKNVSPTIHSQYGTGCKFF